MAVKNLDENEHKIFMIKTVDKIIIKGARQHNLKNIDVEIERNKLVVITGLSGSENLHWPLIPFMQKGTAGM